MEIILSLINKGEDSKRVWSGVSCCAAMYGVDTNVFISIFCHLYLSLINSVWLWKMEFTLKVTLCSVGGHKFSCKCLDLDLNENCSPALSPEQHPHFCRDRRGLDHCLPLCQQRQVGLWRCRWDLREINGLPATFCLQDFQIQERSWLRSSWKWRGTQALVSAHPRKELRPFATLQTGLWDENNSRHSSVGPNLQV